MKKLKSAIVTENSYKVEKPLRGRIGYIGGKKYLFTHRDPISGFYWSDDIPDGKVFGKWIDPNKIQWA